MEGRGPAMESLGTGAGRGEASSCLFLPLLPLSAPSCFFLSLPAPSCLFLPLSASFAPRSQRFHRWSLFYLFLQEGDGEACHYDAYHRHQLDEDIQRWAGGILERVAYRIAYYR